MSPARRDVIAGLLLALLGVATIVQARSYKLGTPDHLGPGLFPALLGAILVLLGAAIVLLRASGAEERDPAAERAPDWRGWACIIGGVVLFIVLGDTLGLGPATFACVFVAALGDRSSGPGTALALAAGCTLFAAVVFTALLHFQLPFLRW